MSRINIPQNVAGGRLKPAAKLVYGFIFTKAEKTPSAFIEYPQLDLAHDTGIGFQIVARSMKELSKAGLIHEEVVRVGQPKRIYVLPLKEQ